MINNIAPGPITLQQPDKGTAKEYAKEYLKAKTKNNKPPL